MKTIEITDRKQIEATIQGCPYCTLAMADAEGYPYAIPMNFAYDPGQGLHGTVYLHSGPHGSKVGVLSQRPEVCITFTSGSELVWMHREVACSYSMKSTSVVAFGTARPVTDMGEKRAALERMMRQYGAANCRPMAEPAVRNVLVWAVAIDRLTCRSFGLRPSEL